MATLDLNAKYVAGGLNDNDSRKWMVYETDGGKLHNVFVSENIGETFGFADALDIDGDVTPLPKRFKMRMIHARDPNGKVSQSFPVGVPDFAALKEGGTVLVPRKGKAQGLLLQFSGVTGEKFTFPNPKDSGQLSGDDS